MSYTFELSDVARAGFDGALDFLLESGQDRSAIRLERELAAVTEVIQANPRQYRPLSKQQPHTRVAKVLWYILVYDVNEDERRVEGLTFRHERSRG